MKEEDFLQRKAGWTQEVTAKLQLRLKSKKKRYRAQGRAYINSTIEVLIEIVLVHEGALSSHEIEA